MSANTNNKLDRRRFLRLSATGAAVAFMALHMPGALPSPAIKAQLPGVGSGDEPVIVARGQDVARSLRAGLAQLGGLTALARPGEVVAIKPTLAWNRHPDFAANTSPAVLREVVSLCLEAGAAEVRVFDRTSFRSDVCYRIAGATTALSGFDQRRVRLLPLSEADFLPVAPADGNTPRWQVSRHILEADRFINLPVAKHHPARKVSLGLPNLLGAVGGPPTDPAWDGNAFIADVARLLQPDLTIIDASRVLIANGPLGRSRDDVRQLDTLVLGTDLVSVDAYSATLFNRKWRELDYIRAVVHQQAKPVMPDQIRVVEV